MRPELTQARLKELLHYDPDTGVFTRAKACGRGPVGSVAGHLHAKGYLDIKVDGVLHQAHRLAFLYMNGAWPLQQVDHRNCDRTDNRWSNLRDVSRSRNQENRRTPQRGCKSGLLGAFPRGKRWGSSICVEGFATDLGTYDDPLRGSAGLPRCQANTS